MVVQSVPVHVENASNSGSGFFIDPVFVATCAHVVRESREGVITSYWGKEEENWRIKYEVVTRGFEGDDDVAILKVDTGQFDKEGVENIKASLSGLKWRKTNLESGEPIMICGFPVNYPIPILAQGVVSTSPIDRRSRILVSAPIQHGNSGGPCFDRRNRVIGLASAFFGFGSVEVFTQSGKTIEDIPRNYGEVVPIRKVRDLAKSKSLKIPWLS